MRLFIGGQIESNDHLRDLQVLIRAETMLRELALEGIDIGDEATIPNPPENYDFLKKDTTTKDWTEPSAPRPGKRSTKSISFARDKN